MSVSGANSSIESISFTPAQQAAYDAAYAALQEGSDFLAAPIPRVVSVEAVLPNEDDIVTLITPSKGHHELSRAMELLEGLEKEEQTLAVKTALTRALTELVTGTAHANSERAIQSLDVLGQAVPRRVCQHPFKKNDIVWVCRTCQADETCVLCHACFSHSQHDGHDVAFYHAQAGGCCDCGDPDGRFSWLRSIPLLKILSDCVAKKIVFFSSGVLIFPSHAHAAVFYSFIGSFCFPNICFSQPGILLAFVPATVPTHPHRLNQRGRRCHRCWWIACGV
jgi:Putative zinc finger in N-recognin (UBR box)